VDPIYWQRAKELFGSALALEPAERSAFLAQACSGDEALRQEIESLLAAHEEAGTTTGPDPKDSLSGCRIGPYQLMHRIGQGGMAMVYLATRADDEYMKCVAIKLILPGLPARYVSIRQNNILKIRITNSSRENTVSPRGRSGTAVATASQVMSSMPKGTARISFTTA
jgi:serine/threonine protein kinase